MKTKKLESLGGVFGKNLKQIRDFLGLSQAELANKASLTAAAISQFETGEREPSLKSICSLLQALNVKFERMIQ